MLRLNHFLSAKPPAPRRLGQRLLARLGPTWRAAPAQRVIQAACWLTFMALLFYVAWPYTATPAATWADWLPVDVDMRGRATLESDSAQTPPAAGQRVFLTVPVDGQQSPFGWFAVTQSSPGKLIIEPEQPLEPDRIDRLTTSFDAWTLAEQDPAAWPSHYADDLAAKERMPAETFLSLDPMVGISTAIASRAWVPALGFAAVILVVCLIFPRAFCGYVCPLGTTIDLGDACLARLRSTRGPPTAKASRWQSLRYGVLLAVLAAAAGGVVLSGFVAAIPLFTRGLVFLVRPWATAAERGWHQVPPTSAGQWLAIALLLAVLGVGFFGRRFWCNHLCPTGAVFSLGNLLRLSQRKVQSSCIACGKCVEACSFDAIDANFATRPMSCTFCQQCGGVCPTGAIQFVGRWTAIDERPAEVVPASTKPDCGRRALLATAAGLGMGALGFGAVRLASGQQTIPVRPPGSLPEPLFLQTCVRCGECLQACPNDALQAIGFEGGLEQLWTPHLVADWSGCEPSCSNCGQVCPTGAIRPLPIGEKRAARMGLAVVDEKTCLPYAGLEDCQLCADECTAAGYHAIEFVRVGTQLDEHGQPAEGSGFLAPRVLADRCVGCGLCQTRCLAVNARQKRLIPASAIVVRAGEGNEDRLPSGSYVELREAEARQRAGHPGAPAADYLPDFLK